MRPRTDIVDRLTILERHLEDEGLHVKANSAWLARHEIISLRGELKDAKWDRWAFLAVGFLLPAVFIASIVI
jgi:hypothetical protein